MTPLLLSFIFVPLMLAVLVWLFAKAKEALALLATIYLFGLTITLYFFRPYNNVLLWSNGVSLILDGLSHLILLLANAVALLVIIYALAYVKKYDAKEKFYALFLLMLTGIQGVVLAGDLLNLFLFIELTAFAAYALVAFGTKAEELEASFKYFVMGEIASIFILFAVGILYLLTGTFNMAEISQAFPVLNPLIKSFVIGLFIFGFGVKMALVPFHAWLPDAHTAAPAPISAMLSGVIIKSLGVYALARILFNVLGMTPPIAEALLFLSAFSILLGSFLMIGQWDMKRLMAYSSVSQVGYVVLGIAIGTPLGIMGGLFHLFNHGFMKALLFLNAGAVEKQTGSRNLHELGGLRGKMPVTALTSLVGSLSISGVPPFNGFWSKLFIIVACVYAGRFWLAFIAVIGSVLTMAGFLKIQKYAFFDELKNNLAQVKEAPLAMTFSMVILAAVCLLLGVAFPMVMKFLINPAVIALTNGVGYGRMILGGY